MLVDFGRTTIGRLKRFADWAYEVGASYVARKLIAGDIEVQRSSNDFRVIALLH